jgi:hypothetical protein
MLPLLLAIVRIGRFGSFGLNSGLPGGFSMTLQLKPGIAEVLFPTLISMSARTCYDFIFIGTVPKIQMQCILKCLLFISNFHSSWMRIKSFIMLTYIVAPVIFGLSRAYLNREEADAL